MKPLPPIVPSAAPADEERHVQRLQRMAMLGTLASGLGHDLRNLVMPILLRLDVLAASADLPAAARDDVARIRESVSQMQRLAAGLRLLGSDPIEPHSELMVTELPAWFRDLRMIIEDALPEHAVVDAAIPDTLPRVAAPPEVLAQVMVTLVMNARRATQDVGVPRLSIVAHQEPDRVCLDVSDNGHGMDEETRSRCFEPFFTTRPREYGTGLGLSTARALLQRYGGDLTLSARAGAGATFTLHLPVAAAPDGDGHRHEHRVRLEVGDPRLRAVLRLLLAQQGLLEWQPEEPGGPHVVVCDQVSIAAWGASELGPGAPTPRLVAIGSAGPSGPRPGVSWVDADDIPGLVALLGPG